MGSSKKRNHKNKILTKKNGKSKNNRNGNKNTKQNQSQYIVCYINSNKIKINNININISFDKNNGIDKKSITVLEIEHKQKQSTNILYYNQEKNRAVKKHYNR